MTDAQPPAGQDGGNDGGGDNGLYDLSSVPEEMRSQLEPHLKQIEGNVTRKFQEAADYRKGWEPFEQLGVRDIDPQHLGGLLEFAKASEDPQWMASWWQQYGEDNGLFDGANGGNGAGMGDEGEQPIEDRIEAAIQKAVGPIYESLSNQEQDKLVQEAEAEITGVIGQIKVDNPNLTDEDSDAILRFAQSYIDEPDMTTKGAIDKGLEDFKRLVAAGERNLFEQKAGQPTPPEGAGAASTQPEKITDWDQANEAAMDRLRATRSAA